MNNRWILAPAGDGPGPIPSYPMEIASRRLSVLAKRVQRPTLLHAP